MDGMITASIVRSSASKDLTIVAANVKGTIEPSYANDSG